MDNIRQKPSPIVITYARMIAHGTITIENVPLKFRKMVEEFDPNELKVAPVKFVTDSNKKEKSPSIYLEPIYIEMESDNTITFNQDLIFGVERLGEIIEPENLRYSIIRVENVYEKFNKDLTIDLIPAGKAVRLKMNGEVVGITTPGCPLVRVDLKLTSNNYEDMRITVYVTAK